MFATLTRLAAILALLSPFLWPGLVSAEPVALAAHHAPGTEASVAAHRATTASAAVIDAAALNDHAWRDDGDPEVTRISAQLFDTRRGVFVEELIDREETMVNADMNDAFAASLLIVATVEIDSDDYQQVRVSVLEDDGHVSEQTLFDVEGAGAHHLPLWHEFDPCGGAQVEVEILDSGVVKRAALQLECTGC